MIADITAATILKGFDRKLEKFERDALTSVLMDTDIGAVWEAFDVKAMLENESKLGEAIKITKGKLKGKVDEATYNYYKNQADGLGYFMTTGVGMATLKHNYNFLNSDNLTLSLHKYMYSSNIFTKDYLIYAIIMGLTIVYVIYFIMTYRNKDNSSNNFDLSDLLSGLAVGIIFGFGLSISGMIKREKVINFLAISSDWDPSLIFVLGVSVSINFITFKLIINSF